MVFQEVLLIAAIPGAFIIGIAVLGTVRAVKNGSEKGRRLGILPPVLLVASVIWALKDFTLF